MQHYRHTETGTIYHVGQVVGGVQTRPGMSDEAWAGLGCVPYEPPPVEPEPVPVPVLTEGEKLYWEYGQSLGFDHPPTGEEIGAVLADLPADVAIGVAVQGLVATVSALQDAAGYGVATAIKQKLAQGALAGNTDKETDR